VASKLLILSPYLSDRATLTPSSELASEGLPATNAQDQEPARLWRTQDTDTVNQYVNIEFADALVADTAAFTFMHDDWSASAQWKVQVFSSQANMLAGTSAVFDSGYVSIWPLSGKHTELDWGLDVAMLRWTYATPQKYYRVWFTDASAPTTNLDICRIALGAAVQFVVNPKHDGSLGFVVNDVQEPNGYGQTFTDERPYAQRRFELVWSAIGENSLNQDVLQLARLSGQARDFYVFKEPDATTDFHIHSMQALYEGSHKFSPVMMYVPDKNGGMSKGYTFSTSMIQKL